ASRPDIPPRAAAGADPGRDSRSVDRAIRGADCGRKRRRSTLKDYARHLTVDLAPLRARPAKRLTHPEVSAAIEEIEAERGGSEARVARATLSEHVQLEPPLSMAPQVLAPMVQSIRDCLWYAKRLYQGEAGGEALVAVLVHEDGEQDAASWRWACLRRQPYAVTRGRRRAHQAVARGDHKFAGASQVFWLGDPPSRKMLLL